MKQDTVQTPADGLTFDKLFASGQAVIGQRGECETWSVASDPKAPGRPALERTWTYKYEEDGMDCTGFKLLRLVLGDRSAHIESPTVERISCSGPNQVVGSVLCGGSHTWLVHKRSSDSITLVLPPESLLAPKAERGRYQTWYLTEAACVAEHHIVQLGGCN